MNVAPEISIIAPCHNERENLAPLVAAIRATLDAKQFKAQDRMIDRLLDQGYSSTDISSALLHLLQGGAPGTPAARAATTFLPARSTPRPSKAYSRLPRFGDIDKEKIALVKQAVAVRTMAEFRSEFFKWAGVILAAIVVLA
mgnify:CR=1 FL=1